MTQKVPITIITGYLGAGKTTLLRNIAEESGKKIAILMNEFGEIAIDSKVVEGKNIKMAELAGGCVCCSLAGEFEAAVAEILERVKPEWIVVETTGVAEPAALAYDVVENIAGVRLDAIITIIDADSMVRFPSLGHTGKEQIELADLIIINKTDLISLEQLDEMKNRMKDINNRAHFIATGFCKVEMEAIFGIDRERAIGIHNTHKIELEYFDYSSFSVLDHTKLIEFLDTLDPDIYRSKGFVITENGCFLMNYVAGRHTMEKFECERTELVFIGKGILRHKNRILKTLDSMKRI